MKKYSEDYELVTKLDKKGREKDIAVYRGDYFRVTYTKGTITHFRNYALFMLAVIVILHVGAGFLNNRGMSQFYVAIPYVTFFFPLLYLAAGILHIPGVKEQYQRDEVGLSFERMKTSVMVLLITQGIVLLGALVFLVFFAQPDLWLLEILFIALEGLSLAAGYYISYRLRQVNIEKINKTS